MRYIKRLPKPNILVKKEEEWLKKFLEKRKTNKKFRPANSTYRHDEIYSLLCTMSKYKCFYCEQTLKGIKKEIEHHIEIQCDATLAFDWDNLNLSCAGCNAKLTHKVIPISDALQPCIDSDDEIEKHISFNNEQIYDLTTKGDLTIKKYKLDRENLDYLRLKELQTFKDTYNVLLRKAMREKRTTLSPNEYEILKEFARKHKPFSFMFKVLLKKEDIL